MQKLNAHGKLVLGLALALTATLPLACGSDDSNGVPSEEAGASGKGGSGGTGSAGKASGGSAGKAGSSTGSAGKGGGSSTAGSAGVDESQAGAAEMGGEGGAKTTEPGAAGAGGEEEMGGAGGEASDPVFEANIDTTCTIQGGKNCSGDGAAADKESCVELWTGAAGDYPACLSLEKTLFACLAGKTASAYTCSDGQIAYNEDTCSDENVAFLTCFSEQPSP